MARRLLMPLACCAVVLLASFQAPAVQKSKTRPKPKTTVAAKASVKTKAKTRPSVQVAAKPKASNGSRRAGSASDAKKAALAKKAASTAAKASASSRAQKKQPQKKPTVLPRLVDLGANKCIPCKMMAPILEELAREYKGKLKVEFIDVWENRSAGEKYGIRVIPTQIFFDRNGEEFFRHEGFYSKEDILRKFKDQGIDLNK
ncbi:MAG: thioredoxin family protein [Armatimonadota bacterium]